MNQVLQFLAHRRVPLGFLTAVTAFALARPTWPAWQVGVIVACVGEGIRIWAAGHLEKSLKATTSGPYQWTRHPLYVGSTVLAIGVVIATQSQVVAVLAALYLGATLTAAIRTEEAFLRRAFGDAYDRYSASQSMPATG